MNFEETVQSIEDLNQEAMEASLARWHDLSIPLDSLGKLQDAVVQMAGIQGTADVTLNKKALVAMCADNGVVEEGISQSGQDVTLIISENFQKNKATAAVMCRYLGADVFAVDIGIASDSTLIQHKVRYGTRNMAKEPALTREETIQAIEVGIHMAEELKEKGYGMIATGEMGIGNTTTSSAVTAVLLHQDPAVVTGRGAGLSSAGLEKKIAVIGQAIAMHKPDPGDPVDVLSKVGGLDIAGMTGLFLGGAAMKIPVVIDGFISGVAALCAAQIEPKAKQYMFASHLSKEPASGMVLDALGLSGFLNCNMRLGEGSGAVLLFPILDIALTAYRGVATFDENDMETYVPLS